MRRLLIGEPLATHQAIHQRLSKPKALAVFSSDALSSSAYATEAILLILIAAGAGALGTSWWIALGISALMITVAFSYFQTIHAYPNGGGAYIVAKDNLGTMPGLTAAASLLIDYILTVAVSVSAGVSAIASAFPALNPWRIHLALVIVAFITVMNLRGVKESGTVFSIPTYMFVAGMLLMIAVGIFNVITGHVVPVAAPSPEVVAEQVTVTGGLSLFLLMRAFAAGCTALTGIEAISNGIPAFKVPESKNAGQTLIIMVALLCTMFVGITFLANHYGVIAVHGSETTVLSEIAGAVFGEGSILFYYLQFSTLFILSLAANTAYADFPRLASLIARDRFLPRQLTNLGDRLVFSNGILTLALVASGLIVVFDAREHNLLPLYAVGVFVSFTLSQSGMVRHWLKERHKESFKPSFGWRFKLFMNGFGAVSTFVVLIILVVTKFEEGAWLITVAIPIVMMLFRQIHKHYENVASSLTLDGIKPGPVYDTTHDHTDMPVVVLMNSLNRCSLQALECALRMSSNVRICAIEVEPSAVDRLHERWEQWQLQHIPLDIIESPYREIGQPLIEYLHQVDGEHGEDIPTVVVIPEFVVLTWWEKLLHNQTTIAIRAALYRDQIAQGRGRSVINVPYRIGDELYEPLLVHPTQGANRKINLAPPETMHQP
ncbi:MAG: APC family permease [Anaerolineaceae bacterium]|nr:APC family permease [Anaerolineaceae bacterium]